jgi:hypothetical protein
VERTHSQRFPVKFQNFCSGISGLLMTDVVNLSAAYQHTTAAFFGTSVGRLITMSFLGFHELAAERGDGLHPQFRVIFERLARGQPCEIKFRADGMLQAGPDPAVTQVTPSSASVNPSDN